MKTGRYPRFIRKSYQVKLQIYYLSVLHFANFSITYYNPFESKFKFTFTEKYNFTGELECASFWVIFTLNRTDFSRHLISRGQVKVQNLYLTNSLRHQKYFYNFMNIHFHGFTIFKKEDLIWRCLEFSCRFLFAKMAKICPIKVVSLLIFFIYLNDIFVYYFLKMFYCLKDEQRVFHTIFRDLSVITVSQFSTISRII